jgi:hypothetical protein
MATNLEVITDALGLLGVLAETETASAEQGAHGLRVLNDMLSEWESSGLELDYFPQTDLSEEFPSEDLALVKYNLAVELAPYYQATVSEAVAVRARQYYARRVRDWVRDSMVEQDVTHMPMGEGHWIWKDITQ